MSTPSKSEPDAASELATLFPSAVEVKIGDETITLKPLSIRKLGAVAKPLKRIADAMPDRDIGMSEIVALFTEHTDDMIAAIVHATDKPEKWVADLMPDDFIRLGLAVFKVNAGFFTHRLPTLAADCKAIVAGLAGDGPTPLRTSPAAGTTTLVN